MLYQTTQAENRLAKMPHHLFNINILLTHLFLINIILELGLSSWSYGLIPLISTLVLLTIYVKSQAKAKQDSWFIAVHWRLAWSRSKALLISYLAAFGIMLIYHLIDCLFPGGMSMNSLSLEDIQSSQNIGEVIALRFSGTLIFVVVLWTFILTAGSTFNAGRGEIEQKWEKVLPRPEGVNPPLTDQENH